MGGTNKKVTVGYKYYLGVLFGLWKGPIDKVTKIEVDKRTAWATTSDDAETQIAVDAEDLFGGEAREGGISGTVDFDYGGPAQGQNDYLVSKLGADIPAFRGVTTAVLRQCYMGNNPYLKPWAFRGERIHTRQDGIAQWYDERAQIDSIQEYYDGSQDPDNLGCFDLDYDLYEEINFNFAITEHYNPDGLLGATFDDPNGPVVATLTGVDPSDIFIIRKREGSSSNTRAYVMGWDSLGIPPGEGWATNRFVVTTPDDVSTLYWPATFDDVDDAESYALAQDDVYLYGYSSYKIWLWDDVNVGGGDLNPRGGGRFYARIFQPDLDGYDCYVKYSCNDMNPAHIIRECLTDPDWGMGYNDSDIDDTSFMAAADALWEERFGLSITWSGEAALVEFVNEILRHIDAVLYVDRTSGKFVLNLVRNDYSIPSLVELDESNVVGVTDSNRPAVADLISTVTVNFYDRSTGETGSITRHNQSLLQIQQGGNATTAAYPAITSGPLADRVCQRDLVALSTPLLSCRIEVGRIAESLNIGDPFIFTWPDLDIDSVVMRVQQMQFGNSDSQVIVIEAIEDVFALPATSAVGGNRQAGIWTDPLAAEVLPASPRVVTEVPYYELVRGLGTGFVGDVLGDDPDAGYLLAAAGRQGTEFNSRLLVDSGAGYVDAEALDFCPVAYAAADVYYTDTVIELTGVVDIDLVENNSIAQFGDELIRIDTIDQDSNGVYLITVGRGILDTVPAEHAAGDAIVFWGYDWSGDSVQYTASDELDIVMRPQLGSNVLPLADAPVDSLTLASRAIRPYPPGDLQVDAVSYPPLNSIGGVFYVGDHAITWKHRDREQQTGDIPEDYTATNIGPEAGTTYTLTVYATLDDDSTEAMETITGITGNSYDMTGSSAGLPAPDNAVSVHFRVTAVRGGYASWQSPECALIAIFPGQTRILQDGTTRTLEDGTTRVTES